MWLTLIRLLLGALLVIATAGSLVIAARYKTEAETASGELHRMRSSSASNQLRLSRKADKLQARVQELEMGEPVESWIVSVADEADRYQPEGEPEFIWCDGYQIPVGTALGEREFTRVWSHAVAKGLYNEKNLDEGGYEDLRRDWWRVQGYGPQAAEIGRAHV